jgi:hypothetical protein
MNKTEQINTFPQKAGYTDWQLVRRTGKEWYQKGVFLSPNGICLIHLEAMYARIETVVGGIRYEVNINRNITPRGASMKCSRLLKKLIKEQ